MNWFEKLLDFLSYDIAETPTSYGPLHLLFLGLVIAVTVLLCVFFRNTTDKKFRWIIGIMWGLIFFLEIYKQLQFSCHTDGTTATWSYQWYAFPFQFCSTPLFIMPFVAFLPKGKVRDACAAFLAFFSMFAGLAVYAYPGDIFVKEILISIQSLIHHGVQVIAGIFIAVYYRKQFNLWFLLEGFIVFVCMVVIATILNCTVGPKVDGYFNLFYISHRFNSSLPVLSSIQPKVPYPVFYCIYLFGFGVCGSIMFGAELGIMKLVDLIKSRKNTAKAQ